MNSLILSLFPGIGLLDMAFELESFCVVRGPDVLWGGDIRRFHAPAGRFDGIIGGPPCQMFSSLARLVEANGHKTRFGNLIPEFERCVREAAPLWFLMENVEAAPVPSIAGYGIRPIILDNSMLAGDDGFGQEQRRVRRFSFGLRGAEAPNLMKWIDLAVFLLPNPDKNFANCEHRTRSRTVTKLGPEHLQNLRDSTNAHRQKTSHETIHGGHGKPPKTIKKAVSSSNGGNGSQRVTTGAGNNGRGRYRLVDAIRLQGLPEGFLDDSPFTSDGKLKAIANGVPLPMGRAIARAVKAALEAI